MFERVYIDIIRGLADACTNTFAHTTFSALLPCDGIAVDAIGVAGLGDPPARLKQAEGLGSLASQE